MKRKNSLLFITFILILGIFTACNSKPKEIDGFVPYDSIEEIHTSIDDDFDNEMIAFFLPIMDDNDDDSPIVKLMIALDDDIIEDTDYSDTKEALKEANTYLENLQKDLNNYLDTYKDILTEKQIAYGDAVTELFQTYKKIYPESVEEYVTDENRDLGDFQNKFAELSVDFFEALEKLSTVRNDYLEDDYTFEEINSSLGDLLNP